MTEPTEPTPDQLEAQKTELRQILNRLEACVPSAETGVADHENI